MLTSKAAAALLTGCQSLLADLLTHSDGSAYRRLKDLAHLQPAGRPGRWQALLKSSTPGHGGGALGAIARW